MRKLPAIPRRLDAAERQARVTALHAIHETAAALYAPRNAFAARGVARPHATPKPVTARVCDTHGLFFIACADDGGDGTDQLFVERRHAVAVSIQSRCRVK